MLITPQVYFNNPFHYDFDSFDVLPTNEGHYKETIDDYIDEDVSASYDRQYSTKIENNNTNILEERYADFGKYQANYPYCYFIIDYYFVSSKLENLTLDIDDLENQNSTINYIANLIDFISVDMDMSIDLDTITGSVFVIKLRKRLRDINDDPIIEELRKEYCDFFSDYKNLKSYCL